MTKQEIKETLEKQLQLLSERSADASCIDLVALTNSMIYAAQAINSMDSTSA